MVRNSILGLIVFSVAFCAFASTGMAELQGTRTRMDGKRVDEAAVRAFVSREYFNMNLIAPLRLKADGTYVAANEEYVENGKWRIEDRSFCLTETTEGKPASDVCWSVADLGDRFQVYRDFGDSIRVYDVNFVSAAKFDEDMKKAENRIRSQPTKEEEEAKQLYLAYNWARMCKEEVGSFSDDEMLSFQAYIKNHQPELTREQKDKVWASAQKQVDGLGETLSFGGYRDFEKNCKKMVWIIRATFSSSEPRSPNPF